MRLLAALTLVPAVFGLHSGWHSGATAVHNCPGVPAGRCVQAAAWAATIRLRDCPECLPHRTLAVLPAGGIILQVTVSKERPARNRPAGKWPPTITAAGLTGIEGVPARYGVFQKSARYGREDVYVWAFFGRAHPTVVQLAAANAELRTVRLVP